MWVVCVMALFDFPVGIAEFPDHNVGIRDILQDVTFLRFLEAKEDNDAIFKEHDFCDVFRVNFGRAYEGPFWDGGRFVVRKWSRYFCVCLRLWFCLGRCFWMSSRICPCCYWRGRNIAICGVVLFLRKIGALVAIFFCLGKVS